MNRESTRWTTGPNSSVTVFEAEPPPDVPPRVLTLPRPSTPHAHSPSPGEATSPLPPRSISSITTNLSELEEAERRVDAELHEVQRIRELLQERTTLHTRIQEARHERVCSRCRTSSRRF
ncbi:uncharacterized protein BDZ99DRAFT_466541 [Mytilinidion resinicola]|uniref:Uncharacterized protein n=1 Tax=Mytilinidion resinicola TaxID=574789 RepID=A0A6A6YC28_9PEZI|nr:uncharacterized protein BDZ99DRAFT_466541 [Mytilinidion resinicola]KAF2805574.1 hypothetical protein BDZ99DRAFT_466541 [Mytilinidion resinicola]